MRLGFALAAAALAFSAAAWAQTPESPPAKPTVRELAYKFVHDPNSVDMVADARADVQERLDEVSSRLSPSLKAWFNPAMSAALDETMTEMIPVIEEKLITAYTEKFTAEELQQVLDFQAFVRQPRIAEAYAEASKAGGSGQEKMQALRDRLPPEDFNKIVETTLRHPMLTITMVTVQLTNDMAKEFLQRFQVALSAQCATAPEGIPVCKDQGRAL